MLSPEALAGARFIPGSLGAAVRVRISDCRYLAAGEGSYGGGRPLDDGGVRLLIQRRSDVAVWRDLPAAEYAFLDAIFSGGTLGDARIAGSGSWLGIGDLLSRWGVSRSLSGGGIS